MKVTIPLLFKLYFLVMGLSIVADFLYRYTTHPKHHFPWEFPAFMAGFGFVMCILLVVVSKGIGHLLMRDEDYYEKL